MNIWRKFFRRKVAATPVACPKVTANSRQVEITKSPAAEFLERARQHPGTPLEKFYGLMERGKYRELKPDEVHEIKEAVRQILGPGTDINAPCPWGSTLLDKASQIGNVEILRLLLERGAGVNKPSFPSPDPSHTTPLRSAALYIRPEAVRLLLAAGADSNARNDSLAIMDVVIQAQKRHRLADEEAKCWEIVRILKGAGARILKSDPSQGASEPISILRALENQNPILAAECIDSGGDLYEQDQHGNISLHYAAGSGYLELIDEFVRRGVPVDTPNGEGLTPLVYAMAYGQVQAGKRLWDYQRRKRQHDGSAFERLVEELCTIGVDRTMPPVEASSGYFQKDSSLEYSIHPRARAIGEELYEMGGNRISVMQRAAESVRTILGTGVIQSLSICWDKIGEKEWRGGNGECWMH